jgi:hypothetical protein
MRLGIWSEVRIGALSLVMRCEVLDNWRRSLMKVVLVMIRE